MQRPSTVPSQYVEGGEQRRRSVAFIIMGHGGAFARLQRQARLRAIQRLDLAFLVDGQHHRVTRRRHVKANHIFDFFDEGGIVGFLEGAQAVRLKAMGLPDALNRAKADAGCLGDRSPGPMGGVSGRLGTRHRQHFRDRLYRQGRLAGLARFIAQKTIHPLFGVTPLPAPYCRSADPAAARHVEHGTLFGGMEDDLCPLHMLLRIIPIPDHRRQTRTVFGKEEDAQSLRHPSSIDCFAPIVNPMFASVH
jgi:hypothetical protein